MLWTSAPPHEGVQQGSYNMIAIGCITEFHT